MDIELPIDLSDDEPPRIPTPDVGEGGELELLTITVESDGKQVERYSVHPHLWSMIRHQLDRFIDQHPLGRVMYDGRWEEG